MSTPPTSTLPAGRVVEAGQQVEQRRLAGARRPADRDDLAGLDDQVEVAQHLVLAAVREVHGSKRRPTGPRGSGAGFSGSGSGSIPSSQREAAAGRSERPLAEVRDPAERLERPHELEQQCLEEDELADREVAADHLRGRRRTRRRRSRATAGSRAPAVLRLDARLAQNRVAHRLRLLAEAAADVVLAAERLHHLDADDDSSAASVTLPFRSCTWRESGETRRANRSARTVIGGIATAV